MIIKSAISGKPKVNCTFWIAAADLSLYYAGEIHLMDT